MRYWTLSNIPLFLLATPSMYLMLSSPFFLISKDSASGEHVPRKSQRETAAAAIPSLHLADDVLNQLALPQVLLALMALFSFHVQIITRISSGYPVWYFAVATAIETGRKLPGGVKPEWVVRWMVVYGIVQGGLFASFLPPA